MSNFRNIYIYVQCSSSVVPTFPILQKKSGGLIRRREIERIETGEQGDEPPTFSVVLITWGVCLIKYESSYGKRRGKSFNEDRSATAVQKERE